MNRFIFLFYALLFPILSIGQGLEISDNTIFKTIEGKQITLSEFQGFIASGDYTIDPILDANGNAVEIRLVKLTKEDKIMQSRVVDIKAEAEDKPVIPFNVVGMDGKSYSSEGQLGKVTAIKFWFKECAPCIEEMPKLNKLVAEYADNDSVDFLAFGLDNAEEITAFIQNTQFDYTLVPSVEKVRQDMKIIGYPTHIVVDKKGIVTEFIQGGHLYIEKELKKAIEMALGNQAPPSDSEVGNNTDDETVGFVIDPGTNIKDEDGNEVDFDSFMKMMETGNYIPVQAKTANGKEYIILRKKS